MCGIAGIWLRRDQDSNLRARIRDATSSLTHRGPDHQDVVVDESMALGHTRLSIVDLSAAGNQPMRCEQTGRCIVFNGEIYNFAELRRDLERSGYTFRSLTDTETILHGYSCWGDECFEKLNGMFALAIWDKHEQTLVLARDRFGIKPLYYHRCDDEIVFASEIKAVLAAGARKQNLRRTINVASLHEFAYFGTSLGAKTLFDGIQQVRPGELIRWELGRERRRRYWTAPTTDHAPSSKITIGDAVDSTRTLLENAVRTQLTGDVPIGVFLSGGLDSSAITAFAARHYRARLRTYAVEFDFMSSDQLSLARQVADRYNTDHNEIRICGASVADAVQRLVSCHDAPFSDAANIPLYLLAQRVSGDAKVILQGDGGDELFGGYRRYRTLSYERLMVAISQTTHRCRIDRALRASHRRYLECFLPSKRHERFARLLTVERVRPAPIRIFSPDLQQTLCRFDPFARYREVVDPLAHLDAVQAMLATDTQIILPDVFLEKVDKSTMAHGIEVRVPFLENQLADFIMRLPSHIKVRRGAQKWLLRRALTGILPEEVVNAPKQGFGVPYSEWLRGPLAGFAHETIFSQRVRDSGVFNVPIMREMLEQHGAGRPGCGFLLWKAMNLAIWIQQYGMLLPSSEDPEQNNVSGCVSKTM